MPDMFNSDLVLEELCVSASSKFPKKHHPLNPLNQEREFGCLPVKGKK